MILLLTSVAEAREVDRHATDITTRERRRRGRTEGKGGEEGG